MKKGNPILLLVTLINALFGFCGFGLATPAPSTLLLMYARDDKIVG